MYREALRQAWVEIDLDALEHNIRQIKAQLGDTDLIAVIKANAYGHGAKEAAEVLRENGIDRFAVATIDEGIDLREAGCGGEIIVLGITPKMCADIVVSYGLTPIVSSYEGALALSDEVLKAKEQHRLAESSGLSEEERAGYVQKVLFAIDTGMGRIGYRVMKEAEIEYAVTEFARMSDLPGISVTGLVTHFSMADEEDRTYTEKQIERYRNFYSSLEKEGFTPEKIAANSAAIMVYPEVHFDAARPGIILYGCYPSSYLRGSILDLKPVMSVHANIVYVKRVPEGTSVSYGGRFCSERETVIATIPVGYADGYSRLLNGKAEVLVNGVRCPVIGSICMDQCMIDVTDLPDVDVCTEVVLMGASGDDEITADELAYKMGTINYEITCGFGQRLQKIFIRGEAE